MNRELRLIQTNLNKSHEAQHALHNDEAYERYDVILGQEPHCRQFDGEVSLTGATRRWTTMIPQGRLEQWNPVRSCLWIHNELGPNQIPVQSPHVTAAVVRFSDSRWILFLSIYIPPADPVALLHTMNLATTLITEQRTLRPHLELVVAGDFNRHDTLWGGDHIALSARQGEAWPII